MLTANLIVSAAAFICAVLSASGRPPPLWVSVILLSILGLLQSIPLGR